MDSPSHIGLTILGALLIAFSLGILGWRQPVHASLSFLGTLLSLAILYIELHAEFIGVMQILVYAGAILVLFMFVIILFQDAHREIDLNVSSSSPLLLGGGLAAFLVAFIVLGVHLSSFPLSWHAIPQDFGSARTLGQVLYLDFFVPFEAVVSLFLIGMVGAFYIAKRDSR